MTNQVFNQVFRRIFRGIFDKEDAVFSPASIFSFSEPGIWYDPSDTATLFQDTAGTVPVTAPGQIVARVNDKSGNGNHAIQLIPESRPIYQVDVNGKSYLAFDGLDDSIVTPTITPGTDKAQVFAGVRKLSDAAAGVISELSINATNNAAFFLLASSSSLNRYQFASRGTATVAVIATGYAAPITNVVTGLGDIAGDIATIRVDGVQAATSATDQGTGNYSSHPIYIGRRGGGTLPLNGNIYSIIARFGENLDAETIVNVEKWVAEKSGLVI